MKHTITGRVTSVGEDYGRKSHVRVEIEHGRASPAKKGSSDGMAMPSGAGKMHSSVTMPREHAVHYPVGKNVSVSMSPMAAHPGVPAAGTGAAETGKDAAPKQPKQKAAMPAKMRKAMD